MGRAREFSWRQRWRRSNWLTMIGWSCAGAGLVLTTAIMLSALWRPHV